MGEVVEANVFDLNPLRFCTTADCPNWGDVFAWDERDIYVLKPQSCGGSNCGGDYTGYYWSGLHVRNPAAFVWLSGGYAAEGRHIYNVWSNGPLDGAHPAGFHVLLCGDEATGCVVGRDGDRFYRDGKLTGIAKALDAAGAAGSSGSR